MRRIVRLLAMAGTLGGAVWIMDARRRAQDEGQPLSRVMGVDFREFVTHRFNPVVLFLGLAGGHRSVWGILEHVGRTTDRIYRAPVLPVQHGGQVFIRLSYGTDVDWVKNVRAAGHCRVQVHEMVYELDEPLIVGADANPLVPRWAHRVLANRRYLRLHVLDVAPGTFTHPRTTHVDQVEPAEPAMQIVHPTGEGPEAMIVAS